MYPGETNASGAQTEASSAGTATPDSGTQATDQQDSGNSIPRSDHKRALDDMHKFKNEARELKDKVGQMEASQMRDKEDYKALSERYQKESSEWKTKYESQNTAHVQDKKFNAVRASALKSGLKQEAEDDLELLDLSEVEMEATSSGRILIHGVDDYVKRLQKSKPHWFSEAKPPVVNRGGGGGGTPPADSGDLTAKDYVEKERELRRKGDKAGLEKLNERFQAQRKKTK